MTAAATESLPGAIEAPPGPPTLSQGSGTGGGSGTGTGTGIGPGTGSGLGPGSGGGTGGGVYQPGNGVSLPQLVREVKPAYTSDAMRAKIQGTVLLRCIVRPEDVSWGATCSSEEEAFSVLSRLRQTPPISLLMWFALLPVVADRLISLSYSVTA